MTEEQKLWIDKQERNAREFHERLDRLHKDFNLSEYKAILKDFFTEAEAELEEFYKVFK